MILSLDYRSSHVHSRSAGASGSSSGGGGGGGGGGSSRRSEEREGLSREPSQKASSSASQHHAPPSQHLGLCHIHLREQQQLRELQQQAEEQLDINENLVTHSRSRTKSDPTLKSAESITACPESPTEREEAGGDGRGSGFRGRAKTLERPHRSGRFFCDSCKARLKAEGLMVEDGRGGGSSGRQQCSSACASRDAGAVDLMALPLPGSDDEEMDEDSAGKLQPPPPAIAAPPPGFRDNSSDEDDPNKNRKAAAKVEGAAKATAATATITTAASTMAAEASASAAAATAAVATVTVAETQEDVPVTLIDNVATRTVRDHAQELDDALVSTLQALEALAASEDYPHHHQQTPQTAGGLNCFSETHSALSISNVSLSVCLICLSAYLLRLKWRLVSPHMRLDRFKPF